MLLAGFSALGTIIRTVLILICRDTWCHWATPALFLPCVRYCAFMFPASSYKKYFDNKLYVLFTCSKKLIRRYFVEDSGNFLQG